ncbi:MAG: HK97-gp10 family putative phage morphogenesis protein [Bacillota bacterium]
MARKDILVSIDMDGKKMFKRAIKEFEKEFIKEVKRVVTETAKIIHGNAMALAPNDDGNLRKSIEIRYFNGGLSAEIIVGAHYAIYVEYGTGIYAKEGNGRKTPWVYWSDKLNRYVFTRGMKAQPYWGPALDAGGKYFDKELKKLGA